MNGNQSEREARFLEKARQSLMAGEEQLDAAVASRLREARRRAVEAAGEREKGFFRMPTWARIGGVATAAAMGCSEGSVKTHYSRAVHPLQMKLEEFQP